MIGIKAAGKLLKLEPETTISLELNNPLLREDNLSPGSLSFPFDLPVSENADVIGHVDMVEAKGGTEIDSQLFFDDLPFKKGKLKTKSIKGDRASANYTFGLNALADDFKTKKIRDLLNIPQIISTVSGYQPIRIFIKPNGSSPYKVKVNKENFEQTTLAFLATAINNRLTQNGAFAVHYPTGAASPLGYVTAPYIILTAYSTDPIALLSFDSEDSWIVEVDMTDYKQSFTNYLANFFVSGADNNNWNFPLVFNDDILGTKKAPTLDIPGTLVNAAVNSTVVHNDPNYGLVTGTGLKTQNINSLQPFLKVVFVLNKIAEYFNFEWGGTWITEADTTAMLLDNTAMLDVYQPLVGKENYLMWRMNFNLNELVPDISVVAFLKGLQSRYNLCIYVNEVSGKVMIEKLEPVAVAKPYIDLTNIAGPIQEILSEQTDGFTLTAAKKEYDREHLRDQKIIDGGEKEVAIMMGALQRNATYQNYTGPVVAQKAGDKFDLRVFYYRGIVSNGTFTYAQANINATQYNEQLDGVDGIYEKFWKYWLLYKGKRKIVSLPMRFEFRDLNRLNFAQKIRVDNVQYLIKKIKVTLTMKGIKESLVELYTMI